MAAQSEDLLRVIAARWQQDNENNQNDSADPNSAEGPVRVVSATSAK